jgi:hypothetical protein
MHIRPSYIISVANTWADKLSRHLDSDDWQPDSTRFFEMDNNFGPHTIDRFASTLSTLLTRYSTSCLHPSCEAVDSLRFSDAHWRNENNYATSHDPYYPISHKTHAERRDSCNGHPPMAWKGMAPITYRVGMPRDGPSGAHSLFRPERRHGRTCPSLSSEFTSGMAVSQPGYNKIPL